MAYQYTDKFLLNEEDFKQLVNGKIITVKTADDREAHIALQDIGYDKMTSILVETMVDANNKPS